MSRITQIIICFLIALAAGFGFLMYQSHMTAPLQSANDPDYDLTQLEKDLFYFPPAGASNRLKQVHLELAQSVAQSTPGLSIIDCKASPDVLSVKKGATFTVTNKSIHPVTFAVKDSVDSPVAPGQTIKLTANFKNGAGLYGYGCADPNVHRAIGLILVTP